MVCANYFSYKSSLGYDKVYLPLCRVADTPFHIQGDDMSFTVRVVWIEESGQSSVRGSPQWFSHVVTRAVVRPVDGLGIAVIVGSIHREWADISGLCVVLIYRCLVVWEHSLCAGSHYRATHSSHGFLHLSSRQFHPETRSIQSMLE